MKKQLFGFLLLSFLSVGIASVSAVYYDYYGNTYESSKDFFRNYMKNNRTVWTAKSMVHQASVPTDTKEPTVQAQGVLPQDLKDAQRDVSRTQRELSGTLMRLEANLEYPRICPEEWETVDVSAEKDRGRSYLRTVTTTCYSPRTCGTIQFESIVGEPESCPLGWDEAGTYYGLRQMKSGIRKIQTRMCYQCQ